MSKPIIRLIVLLLGALPAYSASPSLPDWSGWWSYPLPIVDELKIDPPPLWPDKLEKRVAAQRNDAADADPLRYCRPPQFTGYTEGFIGKLEFLFTPGRVTMTSETGMLRRIYTDSRATPANSAPSNMGTSVGHWEGETLVIETVGINPDARYPNTGQGNMPIGRDARITERIRLVDRDTIEFDIQTVAPDILSKPDHRTRIYKRVPDMKTASEFAFCAESDRAIDPKTGSQRFDMTPPAGLPPPPSGK
jgi:hypothetical protein